MSRTPLAWKNLRSNWRRLLLGSAGVAFAAVLIFMQNGFRNALLDSPVQLIEKLEGDLFAISVARYSLPSEQRFPRWLLDQAAADADVRTATPLYVERARAQIRVGERRQRPIRVVAADIRADVFRDPEIRRQLPKLAVPNTALLDRRTRAMYGFATGERSALLGQSVELLGRSLRIVGTVEIGTDFAHDGTILLSEPNFQRYFPFRGQGDPLSVVDIGIIRLRPGSDPRRVAERLTAMDSRRWHVFPRQRLIEREIDFWSNQTPIGMIFFVGSVMGFAVGVIICYQILFTSIHDSLPEFATLKAMGYPNRFFVGLVVRQSIYLSLLGFLPAVVVTLGLFELLQSFVGLPMLLTPARIALVLGWTVAMCLLSGLLALGKLLRADPASLF